MIPFLVGICTAGFLLAGSVAVFMYLDSELHRNRKENGEE
jgi:hypothetical protein